MNLVSKRVTIYLVIGAALLIIILALRPIWKRMVTADQTKNLHSVGSLETVLPADSPTAKMMNRAIEEAKNGVLYDAGYARIPYPNGDVAMNIGACTDVVIRSVRAGGIDLQRAIQEDFKANPLGYKISSPDSNIDHRRCPNQICWLKRHAEILTNDTAGMSKSTWRAGDIVYWKVANLDHTGIVSNVVNHKGLPLVIHNMSKTVQEDCLDSWEIVGHYRLFKNDAPLKTIQLLSPKNAHGIQFKEKQ